MKTFLKWPGNKSQIKDYIIKHVDLNCRFVEPFAGSCAISLNIKVNEYLLADVNKDLINVYNFIQSDDSFIDYCGSFFDHQNNSSQKYYDFRKLFNTTNDVRLKSALFIYLNKHTFNGLCRYNLKGEFNSPFGKYKAPYFPKNEMVAFKNKFKNAQFKFQDFRTTLKECRSGDIVYCDPPYVALSKSSNFTSYTKGGFTLSDQYDLISEVMLLKQKGIKVIISNHNTVFTHELYQKADILEQFLVRRSISCQGDKRNKASELLAVFA